MKKFIVIFLTILLVSTIGWVTFSNHAKVYADDDLNQQLNDKQAEIDALQKQLDDAKGQENTLRSQLSTIDSQTKLTTLKIQEANFQITKLNQEITDLSGRITRISTNVDSLSQVLLNRIVETYKYGNVTPIDLIFSSHGFSDLLQKLKYTEVIQANDKKVLYELQATKTAYHDQQKDRQDRQDQETKLQAQLQTYQQDLANQKTAKDQLLRITQNNEATYQAKIRSAQEEQNAILAILGGGGDEVEIGHVSKGDHIANMISGSSACSSGTHLHFEVHQNNSIQDPSNFLSNTGFNYSDNDGGRDEGAINPHGSWDWPIPGTIYVTQGYGMTPYALAGAYNGGPHTGIDMYSSAGLGVNAIHDGTLYRGGIKCGGGTLYYKRVDHGDGISSLYLHTL